MRHFPGEDQFLLESMEDIGILRQLSADYFQSYQAVQLPVSHFVNRAHPTLA
jgi:hypothetical protein